MSDVFLDTSYAIALATPRDQHHGSARRWAGEILNQKPRLVTTDAVILEIGNFFSRASVRTKGGGIIAGIYRDPMIQIIHASPEQHRSAFQLFQARPDKEWGLTDCLSFVIMREQDLSDALTSDEHFRQAGFRALLLGP